MNVSAVVLSDNDYTRQWDGLEVVVYRSLIRDALQLQSSRFNAIAKVQTPYFFFLDDDDDLPNDYLDVLAECIAAKSAITYTDELINGELSRSENYQQKLHLDRPLLIHHLALYETSKARAAARFLPRGHYAPELLLSWQVAKSGAAYIPRVGYHWNSSRRGMHTWSSTSMSWARALQWCKDHP
jgi:hypothetical protein